MKKYYFMILSLLLASISLNAQWQQANGTSEKKVTSFTSNTSNLFAGTFDGVLISVDGGLNWSTTGMTSDVFAMIFAGDRIFAANESNGLAMSQDDAETWTAANSGLTPGLNITSFAYNGEVIYAGTNNGIFKSESFGSNWTDITNNLSNSHITTVSVSEYGVAVGTNGGGIFSSLNGGDNWNSYSQGLSDLFITSFYMTLEFDMFAATYSGIYKFDMDNPGWVLSSSGITNLEVNYLYSPESVVYAGTQNGGLFASFDNGDNWISFSNGLPASDINAIYSNESYLFVGTETHGVWMRPLSEFTDIDEISLLNDVDIYPNPVSGELIIETGLDNQMLNYEILNIAGQVVLKGDFMDKTTLQLSVLNAGVYIIKIVNEGKHEYRKIVKQ
jgi:photosystem II stability/assembly factor-like uncharacterized protein